MSTKSNPLSRYRTSKVLLTSIIVSGLLGHFSYALSTDPELGQSMNVSGLNGELTVRASWGETTTVSRNGRFYFDHETTTGTDYHIAITGMPYGQVCSINNSRAIKSRSRTPSNVTTAIQCRDLTYYVGGSVVGLEGKIVVQTQWGDVREINENGTFVMHQPLTMGTPYTITTLSAPPHQNCRVMDGSGIVETAHITSIQIDCQKQGLPSSLKSVQRSK